MHTGITDVERLYAAGQFQIFQQLFLVLVISKNNHYYSIVGFWVFLLFFFLPFFSCKKQGHL